MSISVNKQRISRLTLAVGVSLIVVFGLLLLLASLGWAMGPAGIAVQDALLGSFGLSLYAMSAAMITLGIFLLLGKRPVLTPWKIVCIVGLYAMVVLIVHLITSSTFFEGDASFSDYELACFQSAKTFGGVVAGLIVYPVEWLIGSVFSYILYAFLGGVLIVGWFNFSKFRHKKSDGQQLARPTAPAAPRASNDRFERAGFKPRTTGINDIGTHGLFVDEIKPSPKLNANTRLAPVPPPRFDSQGKPVEGRGKRKDELAPQGKLYQALQDTPFAPTSYLQEFLLNSQKKQDGAPRKADETPLKQNASVIGTSKQTEAQKEEFIPFVSHVSSVSSDRTSAQSIPTRKIIDCEERCKEISGEKTREERIAEEEARLIAEQNKPTPKAVSPSEVKIIDIEAENRRIIEERNKQKNETSAPYFATPNLNTPSFQVRDALKKAAVLNAEEIKPKKEPDTVRELNDILFKETQRAEPVKADDLCDREEHSPVQSEWTEVSEATTELPAFTVHYETEEVEEKPTDGLDFGRAFGFKMNATQTEETIETQSAQTEEKKPDRLNMASWLKLGNESTSLSEEQPEKPREYLPPTTANIKQSQSKAKDALEGQVTIEDYLQEEAKKDDVLEEEWMFRTSGAYVPPPIDLLSDSSTYATDITDEFREKGALLVSTLEQFRIPCEVVNIVRGPAVSRYELRITDNVSVDKIAPRKNDIAYALASPSVRIQAPIPGKSAIGIEIPNDQIGIVSLREIMTSDQFRHAKGPLPFAIGTDISGKRIVGDLSSLIHTLIAGGTGAGKSSCIHSLILSLISHVSPDDARLILIDPKHVEFSCYEGLPHLLLKSPITEWENALNALRWMFDESERRYRIFSAMKIRNLQEYRAHPDVVSGKREKLPYLVVIIDELADLMHNDRRGFEDVIRSIAQKSRAAGIHMVLATQRPSVDVVTGTIRVNLTSRIAFAVSSQVDSRIILDQGGAEDLLGKGDMLYMPQGSSNPERIQGAFVTLEECGRVVDFIIKNNKAVYNDKIFSAVYPPEETEPVETESSSGIDYDARRNSDELLPKVMWFFIESGRASISHAQRRFRIGFTRAASIVDELEYSGCLKKNSKEYEILLTRDGFISKFGEPTW